MRYHPPHFDFEICGVKRQLPFVKIKDNMALASFCIVSDTELVQAVAPKLAEKLPEVDILLTAEAKGIILTYEMSRLLGKEFVVARKTKKPYMQNVLEAVVYSITTQKKQTLYLDGCDVEKIKGKRRCHHRRCHRNWRISQCFGKAGRRGWCKSGRSCRSSGGVGLCLPRGHHFPQRTLCVHP